MNVADRPAELETVFTVIDYYDGPRKGIANYQGTPSYYECIFDDVAGDYSDLYYLTPIDQHTFEVAMEDWEIWRRWEAAYHSGKVTLDSHPALPEDRNRHEELQAILDAALQSSPKAILRKGQFYLEPASASPPGVIRPLRVLWTQPDSNTAPA
ncbi:MAG TPA: hypothetical protein VFR84_16690 [Candidatus Angelobacter sp.]|nr:hypothetical protein [Candidatus Angelobacter sp.]